MTQEKTPIPDLVCLQRWMGNANGINDSISTMNSREVKHLSSVLPFIHVIIERLCVFLQGEINSRPKIAWGNQQNRPAPRYQQRLRLGRLARGFSCIFFFPCQESQGRIELLNYITNGIPLGFTSANCFLVALPAWCSVITHGSSKVGMRNGIAGGMSKADARVKGASRYDVGIGGRGGHGKVDIDCVNFKL